jgi:TRAP-type mannitol/chloroaromatic compound transport system permease small subunit
MGGVVRLLGGGVRHSVRAAMFTSRRRLDNYFFIERDFIITGFCFSLIHLLGVCYEIKHEDRIHGDLSYGQGRLQEFGPCTKRKTRP